MNKCQRCNKPLITPNASYGWRCAQILGIDPLDPRVTGRIWQKIDTGVKKAESMIKNSPIQMTEKDKGDFYASFAKRSLWDGIDDFKVKEARKEGYSALTASKAKRTNIQKELEEYAKLHKDKNEEIRPDPKASSKSALTRLAYEKAKSSLIVKDAEIRPTPESNLDKISIISTAVLSSMVLNNYSSLNSIQDHTKLLTALPALAALAAYISFFKEHRKGARPSSKGTHQKGQARRKRDAWGEKGDVKRKPRKDKKNKGAKL